MRRRDFITLLGGATAAWPLAARSQQPEQMRRIGVLMNTTADDPQGQARIAAFHQGLQQLGWVEGRNVRTEYRWGAGHANLYRKDASELVALAPDVLLAAGGTIAGALQQVTRTVPIVFVETSDPVSRGLVASMARPGGNTTGFVLYEFSMSGKWLELLKQIAPNVSRVAVVRDPVQFSGIGELAAIQTAAASSAVELTPIDARDANNMESAITAFARGSNSGMIITSSGASFRNQKLIVALATRLRLPAIYDGRFFVTDGGLISYGPERADQFRRAASYVDRILKGEKPADLPVQAPTKFELVINLKTAKALGLTLPPSLLARADEVIE
ncbi:MAG: ABC transporter substrate-binding protein [Pseudolabrys sp.]